MLLVVDGRGGEFPSSWPGELVLAVAFNGEMGGLPGLGAVADYGAEKEGIMAKMVVNSVPAVTGAAWWGSTAIVHVQALVLLAALGLDKHFSGFVRHAFPHTSFNGECKGKSSGNHQEDEVSGLRVVLKVLQVKRGGAAACTAIFGPFFPSAACWKSAAAFAAAFAGVSSTSVIVARVHKRMSGCARHPSVGFCSILVGCSLAFRGLVLGLRILACGVFR